MKKVIRHGKTTLVPRDIKNINVYVPGTKTISTAFSHEDWNDIHIGVNRKLKITKANMNSSLRSIIEDEIGKLSDVRLIRAICLALRFLFSSSSANNLVERLADKSVIKAWFSEINKLAIPLLEIAFNQLYVRSRKVVSRDFRLTFSGYECELPQPLKALIDELTEEAKQLPVYQSDFNGTIIDGEIYHEPLPPHLQNMVREARWKGGYHIDPVEISASQIQRQGGSFGLICLFYLHQFTRSFS